MTQPPRRARWPFAAAALLVVGVVFWIDWGLRRPSRLSTTAPAVALTPIVESESAAFAKYSGSASCRECHPAAYEQWSKSNHGLAERPLRADLDKVAFDPPRSFVHGSQSSDVRLDGERYEVVTAGFGGKREAYAARRVIGNDPLRQFLVDGPGGRMQTQEASYDPHRNEWFDVYGGEDRKPGEWGHWTGRGMTWNSMCAACHNTRLRKNYVATDDSYRTTMAEATVSCEACHGPMKAHVEWRKQYTDAKQMGQKDPTVAPLSREEMFDACGSCHSRRLELTGDFVPGQRFADHFALTVVDESNVYWADGQVRDEDYEYGSFLGSRMHAAGVRCVDCHQPHAAKPVLTGNALCMRCHAGNFPNAPVIDAARHTFHQPDSAGAQCVGCHMPVTTYMQRHPRHDHGFTIPDPLLTKELGVPNACNRCHADKDADWSLTHVGDWYGARMERPSRERARTVAAARRGEAVARDRLLALLNDPKETPYWKGVAAGLLRPWVSDSPVTDALLNQLKHADPLERASAARALDALAEQGQPGAVAALRGLLGDPSRSVRVAVAWALRATLDPDTAAGQDLGHTLAFNADQPGGQMQLGAWELARRNADAALGHYQQAVAWDPNSAAIRRELAVVHGMLGQPEESLKQLQEACRLDPNEAEYRYLLGLAWNELGKPDETIAALREAVRLNPRHARAWYNLGLALNANQQPDAAVDALAKAEAADPADPRIPYARATIEVRRRRIAEARAAALRALQIQPTFADAAQLLRSLPPG